MEGKFAGEGLQSIDEDDDMLSAMARELVERNGLGDIADSVWRALNTEHQKLFPTNSNSDDDASSIEMPGILLDTQRARATENGNHRQVPVADLTRRLAAGRDRLIRRLEILTEMEVEITARHPRLQKPMRLLDWAYFLAEHDDHHLALARGVTAELNHQRFRKER